MDNNRGSGKRTALRGGAPGIIAVPTNSPGGFLNRVSPRGLAISCNITYIPWPGAKRRAFKGKHKIVPARIRHAGTQDVDKVNRLPEG